MGKRKRRGAAQDKFYPVKRIVGESAKDEFEVEWEGLNPETGESWENSWVPSDHCTDDLKETWREEKCMSL